MRMRGWFNTYSIIDRPSSCPSIYRLPMRLDSVNGGIETMIDKWRDAGVSTPTRSTPWDSSWPKFVDDPARTELLGYFENRFGIATSALDGFILLEGSHTYWLLTRSPHVKELAKLSVRTAGIPVLRKMKGQLKPTTAALQAFGARATKNVVPLTREQLTQVFTQDGISLALAIPPGYVILTHHQHIVGCGLYTGRRLVSQIPRSYLPPCKTR
jgi:NOL1/NOP2/fmu family ribosome biogenesis protein